MSGEKKSELTGVRAKFLAEKEKAKVQEKILPRSKIKITIPDIINHGVWMVAQRQAKGDIDKAQLSFIAATVHFEGEQLTIADLRELCDARDIMFMISSIFGDEEEEGEEELGKDKIALH